MDIVARLRDPILFNFDAFDLCDEAADEIERLQNKVQWLELVENTVIKQADEIEKLREERNRLREALQKIAALDEAIIDEHQTVNWLHQRIAIEALEGD